ncbi:MAG TPA: single-stranded DNA-binding protein [Mycobacteriales bacterium]|nr:single-stranded DNA-binding protein [Mycobacteriales bacterium]
MINDTTITVVGNLTANPRMRRLDDRVAVTNFRVASTSLKYDKATGKHVDHNVLYLSVTCWRELAENVMTSLQKGDPVLVTGRIFTREFEKDGRPQSVVEMEAVAVGLDLSKGVSRFQRIYRTLPDRATPETVTEAATDAAIESEAPVERELVGSVG